MPPLRRHTLRVRLRAALRTAVLVGALTAALGPTASAARAQPATQPAAQTFTFEEVPDGFDVPNGYAGLTWWNFNAFSVASVPAGSFRTVVYNPFGDPASFSSPTPFTLVSAYARAVWVNALTLRVVGSLAGAVVFTRDFTITSAAAPQLLDFGTVVVDDVVFDGGGGNPPGANPIADRQFMMDDLTLIPPTAVIPEPGTVALVAAGLLAVGGGAARRRRRAAAGGPRTA